MRIVQFLHKLTLFLAQIEISLHLNLQPDRYERASGSKKARKS
jgi:hypothetical protein